MINMINTCAPHVVFLSSSGEIFFAEESLNFHLGLKVIAKFGDFYSAADFCKNYTKSHTNNAAPAGPVKFG